MLSANSDNFISSFVIWIPFIPFSFMIDVARIFNSMLDRSGDSGHPYFIDLKINTFSF